MISLLAWRRCACIIALGRSFDVIIVGGRIAGLYLGGVLARAGIMVVVLEKEPRFRDRVRGEGT